MGALLGHVINMAYKLSLTNVESAASSSLFRMCLEGVSQCSLGSVWGDCKNATCLSSVGKGWTRSVLESLSNFLM